MNRRIEDHPSPRATRHRRGFVTRRGVRLWTPVWATALALLWAPTIGARTAPEASALPSAAHSEALLCNVDPDTAARKLDEIDLRIRNAENLEEARRIATTDSRFAHGVLERAGFLAPRSESIQLASARLDAFHAEVARADTRHEVAVSFASLTRSSPRVDVGCSYSGGEVIAILLGLILGLIPGLILLILLC